jgi:hypothetical protein
MTEPLDFDDAVDLLRRRLRDADHLNPVELHSFKELMRDHERAIPDHFYWEACRELDALGHLDAASSVLNGGDAHGRLSADGLAYLREEDEPSRSC